MSKFKLIFTIEVDDDDDLYDQRHVMGFTEKGYRSWGEAAVERGAIIDNVRVDRGEGGP